jgi:ferrous iron transport protein A
MRAKACRLRHFGFDEGVTVEPLHLGPFGRDPIAIRVGRMTVAIRRSTPARARHSRSAQ